MDFEALERLAARLKPPPPTRSTSGRFSDGNGVLREPVTLQFHVRYKICGLGFLTAKTGGLAHIGSALPVALAKPGTNVRLLTPAFLQAPEAAARLRFVADLQR
jgi:hypothetical protein